MDSRTLFKFFERIQRSDVFMPLPSGTDFFNFSVRSAGEELAFDVPPSLRCPWAFAIAREIQAFDIDPVIADGYSDRVRLGLFGKSFDGHIPVGLALATAWISGVGREIVKTREWRRNFSGEDLPGLLRKRFGTVIPENGDIFTMLYELMDERPGFAKALRKARSHWLESDEAVSDVVVEGIMLSRAGDGPDDAGKLTLFSGTLFKGKARRLFSEYHLSDAMNIPSSVLADPDGMDHAADEFIKLFCEHDSAAASCSSGPSPSA